MNFSISSIITLLVVALIATPLLAFWVRKWQFALLGCILYIPVSGYVAVVLDRHPVALQAKDFFFIIPAYIGFVLFLQSGIRFSGIPKGFTIAAFSLIFLVLIQLMNPHPRAPELLGGVLGVKIWLFYLPITMISYVFVSTPGNLIIFLRTLVLSSWIPCVVGLAQYFLAEIYGFERVMNWWFGDEAESVSFGYGSFTTSSATIYRIPSTFTFVSQYSYFLIFAFCFGLIAFDIEKRRFWKSICFATQILIFVAGLLSGARILLFAFPMMLFAYLMIKGGLKLAMATAFILVIANTLLRNVIEIDIIGAADHFVPLVHHYVFEWIPRTVSQSILNYPLGAGTGSATAQLRHLGPLYAEKLIPVEGEFSKAAIELGLPGAVIVVCLMLIPLLVNFRTLLQTTDPALRTIASSILIYQTTVFAHCLKANPLDQDPSNMLYWVSVGITFRLNAYMNIARERMTNELNLRQIPEKYRQQELVAIPAPVDSAPSEDIQTT